ncbi:HD domain-containing phosphohydrolase [Desulfovibrio litoralis]|uniref:GAF domain-containing protein n=1 Tax=Desulfovibrio litoralis DSM 11393 TaxID=1121455 RepID=A0A1M7SM05_9BACT|nr:HD domain-containing phosphohydrolase [Desulfovibrio litoralis]SHN59507.1 GAF domain-containing protein [Desulfovibrio litoralis DSM 11393]
MRIKFFGTRGGNPLLNSNTVKYGGNTSCLQIETYNGQTLILDAGSGLQIIGNELVAKDKEIQANILLSHTHLSHIYGIPYFMPLYKQNSQVNIYSPFIEKHTTKEVVKTLLSPPLTPSKFEDLPAQINFIDFNPGQSFSIGDILIETTQTYHATICSAFRISADNWSFVYCTDHEGIVKGHTPTQEHIDICNNIAELMKGAEVAIVDASYDDDEYELFAGLGHSSYSMWIPIAVQAGIQHLYFIHHSTSKTDAELEQSLTNLRNKYSHLPITLHMASEGMGIIYPGKETSIKKHEHFLEHVNRFIQTLSGYKDVNTILDLILREARSFTNAESGAFYLFNKEQNCLQLSFSQNEKQHQNSKHTYSRIEIPLSANSVCGYAGLTKTIVNIPDVHYINQTTQFKYNSLQEDHSENKTISVLAVPFCNFSNELIAVLKLENKKVNNKIVAFTSDDELTIEVLGSQAVTAVDKAHTNRDLVVRMLSMAALHDPVETGYHIQRVGAYSAEIFVAWAKKMGMDYDRVFQIKDQIYNAAMLHDIGKIGISDIILKKQAKLSTSEFKEMEKHCYLGSCLFNNSQVGVDEMAKQIALHHHQKWNGEGYTGHTDIPLLAGEDIPIPARIVAIADTLDALCTERFGKKAYPLNKAIEEIKKDSGIRFDPSIVSVLDEVKDILLSIQLKFDDKLQNEMHPQANLT